MLLSHTFRTQTWCRRSQRRRSISFQRNMGPHSLRVPPQSPRVSPTDVESRLAIQLERRFAIHLPGSSLTSCLAECSDSMPTFQSRADKYSVTRATRAPTLSTYLRILTSQIFPCSKTYSH